jgi:hypothetical protein
LRLATPTLFSVPSTNSILPFLYCCSIAIQVCCKCYTLRCRSPIILLCHLSDRLLWHYFQFSLFGIGQDVVDVPSASTV